MSDASSQPSAGGMPAAPEFLIEAHYYEAGLRVKPLGGVPSRPGWAPPSDYVGFRNEIPLVQGDCVVEIARFLFDRRRVMWVGVFSRSVDQVFGDRGNQAGVGIWLLEADVVEPGLLLHGLSLLAGIVAKGKIDIAEARTLEFVSSDYLPKYIRPGNLLPRRLAGWPYSATAMPSTLLFLARGSDEADGWGLAAEQLLRMSVLPPAGLSAERALILVRGSQIQLDARGEQPDLIPLERNLATELLAHLPLATADIIEQNQQMAAEIASSGERLTRTESALAESERARDSLGGQVAELEKRLGKDGHLNSLMAIERSLQTLEGRTRGIEASVGEVRTQVAELRSQRRAAPPSAVSTYTYGGRASGNVSTQEHHGGFPPVTERGRLVTIALSALLAILLGLLAYVLWQSFKDSPAPSAFEASEESAPLEAVLDGVQPGQPSVAPDKEISPRPADAAPAREGTDVDTERRELRQQSYSETPPRPISAAPGQNP